MDHDQTERFREQIRREERTLDAWTLKYLSKEARAQFAEEESLREGQYPPSQIWKGGPVQQLLDPTADELAAEARRAREIVDQKAAGVKHTVLTRPPLDLSAPVPEGYTCAHRHLRARAACVAARARAAPSRSRLRSASLTRAPALRRPRRATPQPLDAADARHAHRLHLAGPLACARVPRRDLCQAALLHHLRRRTQVPAGQDRQGGARRGSREGGRSVEPLAERNPACSLHSSRSALASRRVPGRVAGSVHRARQVCAAAHVGAATRGEVPADRREALPLRELKGLGRPQMSSGQHACAGDGPSPADCTGAGA